MKKQPIPKIKTTAARLEQMKKYLFSEPINPTLLPTDLSEREQEEIDKLKNSWGLDLGYLNEKKMKLTNIKINVMNTNRN